MRECNSAKRPRFPDRPPLSARQSIRKSFAIGRSHAITLPAKWFRRTIDAAQPYLVCTENDDGTCTIATLAALAPAVPVDQPSDPHDHDDRPQQRPSRDGSNQPAGTS